MTNSSQTRTPLWRRFGHRGGPALAASGRVAPQPLRRIPKMAQRAHMHAAAPEKERRAALQLERKDRPVFAPSFELDAASGSEAKVSFQDRTAGRGHQVGKLVPDNFFTQAAKHEQHAVSDLQDQSPIVDHHGQKEICEQVLQASFGTGLVPPDCAGHLVRGINEIGASGHTGVLEGNGGAARFRASTLRWRPAFSLWARMKPPRRNGPWPEWLWASEAEEPAEPQRT